VPLQGTDLGWSPRLSTSYDGKKRNLYKANCEICGVEMWVPAHVVDTRRYCSYRCCCNSKVSQAIFVNCACCGKMVKTYSRKVKKSKSGYIFCSRECKEKAQSCDIVPERLIKGNYKHGKYESYRSRALRKLGSACQRCGYDVNKKMLDVDLKDGNRKNNKIENLCVLCVWCHALKTRNVGEAATVVLHRSVKSVPLG